MSSAVEVRVSGCTAKLSAYSDAFAGGFVAGIVEGKPLETCVDMGHWLARLSIKELGPQYVLPFPSFKHIATLRESPMTDPINADCPLD